LLDEGDDFGVSPEIGFFARDIGNHRRVGTDRDFLLAVFVLDHQGLADIAGNRLGDRRIGYGRVGCRS
jgi:hypothetical protein